MKQVQPVNVRALQKAVEALIGPQGAAVLERVYTVLDSYEAELRLELDEEAFEVGHKEGFKEGYDAAYEAMYGTQPVANPSVICLPDETQEHDAAVAEAVAGLEGYYEGDSGDEDTVNVNTASDRAFDVIG